MDDEHTLFMQAPTRLVHAPSMTCTPTSPNLTIFLCRSGTAACCVCVDMAGHGKSDFAESYHVIDYVPDVALVADALGSSHPSPSSFKHIHL